jgi:hypothetical protein
MPITAERRNPAETQLVTWNAASYYMLVAPSTLFCLVALNVGIIAIFMPQARRADHLRLRTSSVWAAGQFVAASANLALNVGLAGLVARWRQTEMRAHVPRAPEALRGGGPNPATRENAAKS